MKRIFFGNPRAILLPPPQSQKLENLLTPSLLLQGHAPTWALKSVKGNVEAAPTTPSNPPTSDDARPYVLIRGKGFKVLEAYPKGTEGWL